MTLVLGFDDYLIPAKKLADKIAANFDLIKLHQFPDGETKVTLPENLPKKIIICRTLNQPNHKLTELIITASAARAHSRLGLIPCHRPKFDLLRNSKPRRVRE